ncbi:MAG: GNAT family N-acetyltransferase [Hyphomicrobiaceae bacterium]
MNGRVTVEPLTGPALLAALPDLARLRITVFRDWPYLYDGSLAYEQGYVEKFAKSPGAVIVAARDGDRIVGAATASPMVGHADAFAEPFRARGYDIARICYFGESVLLSAYRGHGIGHAFFDAREAHARTLPDVTHTVFCGVVRPADHPLRPADYVPLDAFWMKRGYHKLEGLVGSFAWLDIGETAKTAKPMQFWMKAL